MGIDLSCIWTYFAVLIFLESCLTLSVIDFLLASTTGPSVSSRTPGAGAGGRCGLRREAGSGPPGAGAGGSCGLRREVGSGDTIHCCSWLSKLDHNTCLGDVWVDDTAIIVSQRFSSHIHVQLCTFVTIPFPSLWRVLVSVASSLPSHELQERLETHPHRRRGQGANP